MSKKERTRKAVLEMVKQKRITLKQASKQCGLSYRQTLRVYERYLEEGDAGLTHQSRGQRSNRRHPHQEAIISLYRDKYEGFGPTLASEYLLDEGYQVNHETLRRWLISQGLWKKQRKRSPYRQRRERREQFGELVQIDGSIHDWFEEGKHDCLLNMVDDATGKTSAILDSGETTRVVFLSLWRWIEKYGIPLSLYVDLKTVYVSPKEGCFSHVQVACNKLGIEIIKARSAQGKGRVERNHAVYQDRFVKDLKLKGIKTITKANELLEDGFIDRLNQKFEKPAKGTHSAHRPLDGIDLNQVLCWEYERKVQHDWTFSFKAKHYQVQKKYGDIVRPKASIKIREHLDGSITAWYKETELTIRAVSNIRYTQEPKKIKPNQIKSSHEPKRTSHWYQSNALLFTEPDQTQKKLAQMRRQYMMSPPKKMNK